MAQILLRRPSHLVVRFDYAMIDGREIPPSSVLAAVVSARPSVSP